MPLIRSGVNAVVVTNTLRLDLEPLLHHAREVVSSKTKLTTVLHNGHAIALSFKYLCLYADIRAAHNLGQRSFNFCSGQRLMQRLITAQNVEYN